MTPTVLLVIVISIINDISQVEAQNEQVKDFLTISYYNECDGKDAYNYTMVQEIVVDCSDLNQQSITSQLVQCQANGQCDVNALVGLAQTYIHAGAYANINRLFLVTAGPLQGKYAYARTVHLMVAYLKKCSSVLGYSYVASKSAVLLISDKLDMNVLISPTGGYEVFKKGCTTICSGTRYVF